MVTCYLCLSVLLVPVRRHCHGFRPHFSHSCSFPHSLTPSHTNSLLSPLSLLLTSLSSFVLSPPRSLALSIVPRSISPPPASSCPEGFLCFNRAVHPSRLSGCFSVTQPLYGRAAWIGRFGISIAGLAAIRGCICCAQRSSWAAACSCEPRRICLLLPWLWPR